MKCRNCQSALSTLVADLGFHPPSNSYLSKDGLNDIETTFPLRVRICSQCHLVQTEDYVNRIKFFNSDYAYFSSTSTSWLRHAENYSDMIIDRFGLNTESFVIELASNDGYLLKNFVAKNIRCLGVEPTDSTADAARSMGVPTLSEFFGSELAQEIVKKYGAADLIVGNNVYAHVPDINDFTSGIYNLLRPEGIVTLEFQHLLRLIDLCQFDTIYHEHYSYLSLTVVSDIFAKNGLEVFDVDELDTHGGSLRIYGAKAEVGKIKTEKYQKVIQAEIEANLHCLKTYLKFQSNIETIRDDLLIKLIELKRAGRRVVAYGAAAKGNTLLNFAGIKKDLISFVSDKSRFKQNMYLPGSKIPILSPKDLIEFKPDYVVILPWNLKEEIIAELSGSGLEATSFITAIPKLEVTK